MLINLRNALMSGKHKPTAKDYVQTGLVAMWDGIENAGWGTHDASATTWKDLSGGGRDLTVRDIALWGDTYLYCDGTAYSAYLTGATAYQSIECVYKTDSYMIVRNNTSGTRTIFYAGRSARLLNTPELRTDQAHENDIPRAGVELYSVDSQIVLGIATANNGAVHQICGVYSDASAGVPNKGYFNGQVSQNTTVWNWGSSPNTCVGDRQIDQLGWPWNGKVFAIRLYSRALTAAEIAANYAIDKARFNLPDAT